MDSIESAQESRDEQSQRELAAFGTGDRNMKILQEERALRKEYERNRRSLSKEATASGMNEDEYAEALKVIEDALKISLDRHREYYDELKIREADATLGAQKAIEDYIDNAQNMAQQMHGAIGTAFSSIEDAFVSLATTGKWSWQDLANSIIAEITRIVVQMTILKAIMGFMGKSPVDMGGGSGLLLGGAASVAGMGGGSGLTMGGGGLGGGSGLSMGGGTGLILPGRASGGPVNMGQSYMVGERGPELFTPRASGAITKNSALAAPTPIVQHITLSGNAPQSGPDRDAMRRIFKDGVRQGLVEANQRNSAVTR